MDTLSVPTPVSSHMSQLSPDEQKLLAKLEEQNRLLETDSKSLYLVSGVLRSPSSLRIFSFEEDSSEWGSVVENWEKWSKKKVKQLKEMIRKGIHPHFRPTVWQMLCNSHSLSVQEQYTELLQNTSPSEKLIQRDLSKLLPHHPLFQGLQDRLQQPLYNILKAYSVLDRDVGYHQGSVFIAGLLLMQMPEEQAFGVFVRLMQDFRLREIYRTHMVELGCCTFQLEGLIQEQLPDLYSHFRTQAFKTSTFSSSWFLTLFLSCLPLTAANRVFDIFMCEGLDIVFRVGLAILQLTETELMKLDAEGMTQFLEKTAPQLMNSNPEQMIATAYQIKYDSKRMKKLEKEYTAMKVKEMEEQEEIKKLQSENKVLRHRIDTLEKSISVPEDSSVDLHEQLVSGKLREADTLIELQEVRNHLKDMEEKWQSQQKSRSSSGSDLQGELMSVRFREAHAQLQLTQNRRRLLQLQTQDQINSLQMKRITERMHSQRERLQELTMQNQRLRSLLGKTTEEEPRKQDCDEEQDDGASTARRLQDQIAELQAQIQTLSRQKRSTRL
uniref:Ecotropic viral integration site 5 n=1 Tax=Astyanax mexicanus TaxID=7994 RepID=W5KGY8_ASTMX